MLGLWLWLKEGVTLVEEEVNCQMQEEALAQKCRRCTEFAGARTHPPSKHSRLNAGSRQHFSTSFASNDSHLVVVSTMGCYKKDDDDKGQCGVIGRVFFYILGFIGIAFSLLTVFSCKFLSYTTIQGTVPATLPSPFTLSETANVGLFRWDNRDEQVENTGCVYYTNDQIVDFDSAFRTAQIVGYVAVLCAGLALLLSTIEFVCCRFCCSIFFLSFLMISGMVTQALTFAIFTTDNMWYVSQCFLSHYCMMMKSRPD